MFKGCFVATITPFKGGAVDFTSYRKLLDGLIDAGIHGLVICGTTGEALSLSTTEKIEILKRTSDHVRGRVPVVYTLAFSSTTETIAHIKEVQSYQFDAFMALCPYYVKPTQEGFFQHFKTLSESSNRPIILYNNPTRGGSDISVETIARLAKCRNIVAIKEASASLAKITAIKNSTHAEFSVMAGNDETFPAALAMGASGVISSTANITPCQFVQIYDAWQRGDNATLAKVRDSMLPLYKALSHESNPIPLKYAAHLLDLAENEIRLPMTSINDNDKAEVQAALKAVGLL